MRMRRDQVKAPQVLALANSLDCLAKLVRLHGCVNILREHTAAIVKDVQISVLVVRKWFAAIVFCLVYGWIRFRIFCSPATPLSPVKSLAGNRVLW